MLKLNNSLLNARYQWKIVHLIYHTFDLMTASIKLAELIYFFLICSFLIIFRTWIGIHFGYFKYHVALSSVNFPTSLEAVWTNCHVTQSLFLPNILYFFPSDREQFFAELNDFWSIHDQIVFIRIWKSNSFTCVVNLLKNEPMY